MSGHETDSLLPGRKTTPNAATAATPNLKARHGLALVVAICGAAALAAVALPRANAGGGLRASPAALKAEALKSGLVQDVDKSRWAPECLKWWQMFEAFPTSENPDAEEKDKIGVSDYDLIAMPAGLCAHNLFCVWENCGVDRSLLPGTPATLLGDFDVNNGD